MARSTVVNLRQALKVSNMNNNKHATYAHYGPPLAAPPSSTHGVGGVLPSSPFTPGQPFVKGGPVIVTTVVPLGNHPTHMICPHCHAEINTATKTTPKMIAYLSGAIIALLGCFLGCCLIPCCLDQCMDVHHTCPYCQAYMGAFRG